MQSISLPDGEVIPKLGQGTWGMGERSAQRVAETAALHSGIDHGMTLIDTAEMYGDGHTETWLGGALSDLRNSVFLVSKVYPHNASKRGVQDACERSLRRLRTDRLDLYLLHWPGSVPLAETMAGFEALQRAGKIRHWGVSNFDTDDMTDLHSIPGGEHCATNQVLYNIARRGPEFDLLPWLAEQRMPAMAYSPIDHARLPSGGLLAEIGVEHGMSATQVALAWVLRRPDVCSIPKASTEAHVRENAAVLELELRTDELEALDAVFKPPRSKVALEML